MTDARAQYDFWQRRLAGEVIPIHDGECQAGFYRLDRKGAEPLAIAYWFDKSGALRCRIGKDDVTEGVAMERWPWASKRPITHDVYKAVIAGDLWPDVNTAVMGHNQAPVDNTPEAISQRMDDLAREAERMIKAGAANTDAESDQASDLANTFGELEAKAIALHKVEKQPHLDAGRVVDGKWFTLRDRASDLKKRLKLICVTPFLTKKAADIRAAQLAAVAAGTPAAELPQQRAVSGSVKRSTGLRTYYSAKITDRAKLLDHLKEHPDVIACIQKIADDAAGKKLALPGCEIVKDERAA